MDIMPLLIAVKNIVVFGAVLSVLIIVHEWGHYITAKWTGVRVEEFAIGFGKTLYSKVINGTNFMIKALPFGGYVKPAGEERSKCTGEPHELFSKSVGERALIVFNGPLVNFIMAYVCFWLVFVIGYPGLATKVEQIIDNGPAMQSGIMPGDKIISIDGARLYGGMHMERLLKGNSTEPVLVGYERDGQLLSTSVIPVIKRQQDFLGIEGDVRDIGLGFHSSVIGGVGENYPAEEAGLEGGDKILSINGTVVQGWDDVQNLIKNSPGDEIKLKIKRGDEVLSLSVAPKVTVVKDPKTGTREEKKIGIGPIQDFDIYHFGPVESIKNAFDELGFITVATYRALYNMVVGRISAKESVAGPVGIFYIVNSAADEGIAQLLYIVAVISASLAIFNLLPVIPLDGGHLFLLAIEKVRGQPLPEKAEEGLIRIGFSLIICLAIFVFYIDIARFGWIDGIINLWK